MNKRVLSIFAVIVALTVSGVVMNLASSDEAATPQASMHTGTVVETMESGGYTYVQVDTGDGRIWAAAPRFQVKVGDSVTMPQGMPMQGFHSKTLDRDFDMLYMVDRITVGGEALPTESSSGMLEGHPSVNSAPAEVDLSGIGKAVGGYTVEELFAKKSEMAGTRVTVRGRVVKFSPNIMGKNWAHLRDGTGDMAQRTDDLTVTTTETLIVGDTVTVEGLLQTDKDFGFGYHYDLILEEVVVVPDASLSKQ